LRASYPDLDAATYVGDADASNVDGFFHSTGAGAPDHDPAGSWLILPDLRGNFLRGYDPTGNRDPDGVGRLLPTLQFHAFEQHGHELRGLSGGQYAVSTGLQSGGGSTWGFSVASDANRLQARDIDGEILGATRNVAETRAVNFNVKWCVRY
jgi:hypothetical protein